MTIKIKYDPAADRMRLATKPEGKPLRVFWLKRNQCLALLARLSDVAEQMGVELEAIEPLKTPPPRPRKDPVIDEAEPEILDALRLRLQGEEAQLLMVQGRNVIGLRLKAPGIKRLHKIVATHAERAGWDPGPGVRRLKVMAMARSAMANSKAGNA